MKIVSFLSLLIILFSCNKTDEKTSAEILMSADWYPYKNEYRITDSSFIYPMNNPTEKPVISATVTDSVAVFSDCGQQTIYSFEDKAVLKIKSTCPFNTEVATTWQLSQTDQMSMYSGAGGSVYIFGPLTDITSDHFVLSVTSVSYYYKSATNGQTFAENHRIYNTVSTAFKRR